MNDKHWIREELEKASLYGTLADYYRYQNPQLHECYYEMHVAAVRKLADLVRLYGDPYGGKPVLFPADYGQPVMAAPASMSAPLGANQPYPFLPARDGSARLRVLHASPDAPAVDVYADGKLLIASLPYKGGTSYAPLPAGAHKIEVYPAGKKEKPVLTGEVKLESGMAYTAAAAGALANLELVSYQDDSAAPQDSSRVRFIHLSPDAPPVDIASKAGDVIFSNVAFKGNSGYIQTAPGTADLQIRPAGTSQAILRIPKVPLAPGKSYTLIAVGFLKGDPGVEVLVLAD
jgi:hypothetical protein